MCLKPVLSFWKSLLHPPYRIVVSPVSFFCCRFYIHCVDAVWKRLYAQTHSIPATEELFDREITAFLAVRDPVGGPRGSRHWMLWACLRAHYSAEQLVRRKTRCSWCVGYYSKQCRSSRGMPIYYYFLLLMSYLTACTPFSCFLSSIIISPFIPNLHPPPSWASARVNSIAATSRINELSYLGALPFLQSGYIMYLERPEPDYHHLFRCPRAGLVFVCFYVVY